MKIKTFVKMTLFIITLVIGGMSALYFFGEGLAAWLWQVVAIAWALKAYFSERKCYRLEKRLELEKRAVKLKSK
jgi:hypothetical protein